MNRRELILGALKSAAALSVINPVAALSKPLTVNEYIKGKIERGEILENETFYIDESIRLFSKFPIHIRNCVFIGTDKLKGPILSIEDTDRAVIIEYCKMENRRILTPEHHSTTYVNV